MKDMNHRSLNSIISDANSVIYKGLDELTQIHADEYGRYVKLKDEYDEAQSQLEEALEAGANLQREYLKAREILVAAVRAEDELSQQDAYFKAEHLMKLKGSLEEREKRLCIMRDHLAGEIRRKQDILEKTRELNARFRMAVEILDSGRKVETPEYDGALAAAVAMAEREASHLARELHDGPAQKFGIASMSVDVIEQYLLRGLDDKAVSEVRSLRGILDEADWEVRAFLQRLNPPGLDQGLDVALKRLVDRLSERHTLESAITVEGPECYMPLYMRAHIFKIIYQAIINAIRNGKAGKITVKISMGRDAFRAVVQDDGVGFDVDLARAEADRRGSYGLKSMEERASLAGGALAVESRPGMGTTVRLRVPMKEGGISHGFHDPQDFGH